MRNLIKITTILLIFNFLSTCTREQNETVMPNPIKIEIGQKRLVLADNKLGFDIYRNIIEDQQNVLVSPLGFNKSFGLLSYATKNNLKIKKLLNLAKHKNDEFLSEINTLNSTIFQLDRLCAFSSSNLLLLNESYQLNTEFGKLFRANKDFKLNNYREVFNQASSNKLNTASFDLKNNINLKCSFKHQTGITESPFYLNPNESKFVEMLVCESEFNFYSDDILKVVEIPIGRGNFNAMVIMPETGQTIESIKNRFSPYYLQVVKKRFRKLNLSVYIPQLNIDYSFSYPDGLRNPVTNGVLGNKIAFEGISDKKLYLNNLSQSVKLEIVARPVSNKEVFLSPKSQSIFIDRPFILLVTEKYSGSIVFIGQITNPVD